MTKTVGTGLKLRWNTYSARMMIPEDVKSHFENRACFTKSLGTGDLALAERLKLPHLKSWKHQIEMARLKNQGHIIDMDEAIAAAKQTFEMQGKTERAAAEIAATMFNPLAEGITQEESDRRVEAYAKVVGTMTPTTQYVKEWATQHGYTDFNRDSAIQFLLKNFCKRFPYFEAIEKAELRIWVDDLLQGRNGYNKWTRRTLSKNFNYVNKLWAFCEDKYTSAPNLAIAATIISKASMTKSNREDNTNRTYIRFLVDDCFRLLDLAAERNDQSLEDLIRLGMYTGCRIGELCKMQTVDVLKDRFVIKAAKTEAGIREIPIHKDIQQLIERLKQTSADGYLLSGLSANNKYKDRSKAMSHRFNRLKAAAGYPKKRQAFHSFRSTLANRFENAGVPENFAARIIGHDFDDKMTYGVYSGGIDFQQAVDAMAKVVYQRSVVMPVK